MSGTQRPPTRGDFIDAYRREIIAADTVGWTRNEHELNGLMDRVRAALASTQLRGGWAPTTVIAAKACRSIGIHGTPTLKRLRALPVGTSHDPGVGQDRVPGGAA